MAVESGWLLTFLARLTLGLAAQGEDDTVEDVLASTDDQTFDAADEVRSRILE